MQLRQEGCVYCGREGPYNDEHVIPAGLGAGNSWLLQNLVCKKCNHEFSKLEVRVLRRGEVGFGRLALQEHGRSRGSKTRAPTFEAASEDLRTEDGRALVIALGHKLAVEILPQITLRADTLEGNGSNRVKVGRFLERLSELLQGSITLIRARGTAREAHTLFELKLDPFSYVVVGSSPVNTPGAEVLWLEASEGDDGVARVLESRTGSIVVQAANSDTTLAAAFLSLVRRNLDSLNGALLGTTQESIIEHPQVHVSAYSPFEDEVARFLAKVGFNLLIHDRGDNIGRLACFDSLCRSVRTGEPELRLNLWNDSQGIVPMLKKAFGQQHWMMLAPIPSPVGGIGLAFASSLYGGAARVLLLADEIPADLIEGPAFFAVDYRAHGVQRFALPQVLARVKAL